MDKKYKQGLLRQAASRANRRAFFVAYDLERYRSCQGWDEEQLASWLGCAVEQLPRLALCRRPEPGALAFRADVERVAEFAGVDRLRLAQLLREVEALAVLRGSETVPAAEREHGYLIAARDREEEVTSEEAVEETNDGEQERDDAD